MLHSVKRHVAFRRFERLAHTVDTVQVTVMRQRKHNACRDTVLAVKTVQDYGSRFPHEPVKVSNFRSQQVPSLWFFDTHFSVGLPTIPANLSKFNFVILNPYPINALTLPLIELSLKERLKFRSATYRSPFKSWCLPT